MDVVSFGGGQDLDIFTFIYAFIFIGSGEVETVYKSYILTLSIFTDLIKIMEFIKGTLNHFTKRT